MKACQFNERVQHIRNACRRLNRSTDRGIYESTVQFNLELDQNHNISFCKIQKAGSTFIKKIFKLLYKRSNILKSKSKRLTAFRQLRETKSFEELQKTIEYSMNIMFLREPFSRAFSGYVDKLFAPNSLYWKATGSFIVHEIRNSSSVSEFVNSSESIANSSRHCGHDVTFPEFMKYLILSQEQNRRRDRHFYPMFDHCSPCKIEFDFVGKMETFKDDVLCLLNQWNQKFGTDITFNDFEKENDLRMAFSQISRLYAMRRAITNCLSFYDGLKRVWKLLEIRGIFPKGTLFPFSESESKDITIQEVQMRASEVIESITNRTAVKLQRREALIEAYSQVNFDDIQTYTNLYDNDFTIFGYDKVPSFIATINRTAENTRRLSYFDML